jgi:hypothetical protein
MCTARQSHCHPEHVGGRRISGAPAAKTLIASTPDFADNVDRNSLAAAPLQPGVIHHLGKA